MTVSDLINNVFIKTGTDGQENQQTGYGARNTVGQKPQEN